MKPAFYNFTENLIRFNEWCEKNKKETIKRFNPEEYQTKNKQGDTVVLCELNEII